jgi:hypothetical protein
MTPSWKRYLGAYVVLGASLAALFAFVAYAPGWLQVTILGALVLAAATAASIYGRRLS